MTDVAAAPDTVDPTLIGYYREASATGNQFRGLSLVPYERNIRELIRSTGAKKLLDYGCGLGHQYTKQRIHSRWGVPQPALYDPGVIGLERRPEGVFDGVICSDVMEHVPEDLVDAVLADVFGYATRWAWLSICCRAAKKTFPDGRNLHVTVRPPSWWQQRVKVAAGKVRFVIVWTP